MTEQLTDLIPYPPELPRVPRELSDALARTWGIIYPVYEPSELEAGAEPDELMALSDEEQSQRDQRQEAFDDVLAFIAAKEAGEKKE